MTQKRSICLINDSFPPVIDGVANAVTNYATVIQKDFGNATVVTPYYPNASDSVYSFPVLRYPSIDMTKLVGYRAGFPLSPELMAQVEERHIDLIHSHCPITSTVLGRMLRQRLHVPLVLTYHTKFDIDIANAIHSKRLQEASIKLLVENISACDEVWTVSRGAAQIAYKARRLLVSQAAHLPLPLLLHQRYAHYHGRNGVQEKAREDKERAWQDYLRLCKAVSSRSYLETLHDANLANPFEAGSVERACGYAAEILLAQIAEQNRR